MNKPQESSRYDIMDKHMCDHLAEASESKSALGQMCLMKRTGGKL